MQPNQDIGETHPPALYWTYEPHLAISHVVLGKGAAGGSWHRMQPSVLSLSTGRWLQLPIYGFNDWCKEERGRGGVVEGDEERGANGRVRLGNVAKYYQRYTEKMGIMDNFRDSVTVTQVQLLCPLSAKKRRSQSWESNFSSESTCSSDHEHTVPPSPDNDVLARSPEPRYTSSSVTDDLDTGEPIPTASKENEEENTVFDCATACDSDDTGISCCAKRVCLSSGKEWLVRGRREEDREGRETLVSVCAKNVVLATGVEDSPKKLSVPGEDHYYVRHTFSDISPKDTELDRPVLVVGAGLAAADAVLHSLSKGLTVVHVFHRDTSDQRLIYHTMDAKVYSEYRTLFQKMRGQLHDPNYTPLAQHRVEQFGTDGVCTLCNIRNNSTKTVAVSMALVLIGGRAHLDFLPECMSRQLGIKSDQPIDAKRNPFDVDPYTFESEQFPSLFAMGPLAGDNFVRFVLGGAVGITKHLRKKLHKVSS